jgi:Zn-dependent protease with chaperone function
LELVIASSFLPFFGYWSITIFREKIRILLYERKEGMVDEKLTNLAREKNLKISNVFVIEVDKVAAYFSHFTNSIILTRKLVHDLSNDEIKAILYHEISHCSCRKLPLTIALTYIFIVPFVVFYMLGLFIVYVITYNLPFVGRFYLGLIVSFLFCMILLGVERQTWANEYKADAEAANGTTPELIIAALQKIIPSGRIDCDSPTHPSLRRRVAAIRAHCNQQDIRK